MRRLAFVVLVVLLAQPGAAVAKKRVVKRSASYGYGLNRLLDQVAPSPSPRPDPTLTSIDYLKRAITDADQWWTAQGSAPPPLDFHLERSVPGAAATAQPHSGYFSANPKSFGSLNEMLKSGSVTDRRKVLTMIWGYAAHERGHNIGYEHTHDGGLMGDGIPSMPGRAYEWAAEMLPRPVKHRIRIRRR